MAAVPLLNILHQGICYGFAGLSHHHGFHLFTKLEHTQEDFKILFNTIFTHKLLVNPTKIYLAYDYYITWKQKNDILKALIGLGVEIHCLSNCSGSSMFYNNRSTLLIKTNYLETYCIPILHGYPDYSSCSRLNMGEQFFINRLSTLIKKHGHLIYTKIVRSDASLFFNTVLGLTTDPQDRPIKKLELTSEIALNLLNYNNLRRLLSICYVAPEATVDEVDYIEVVKTIGSFKTVYKQPNYKIKRWIIIPAFINSDYGYCIPTWILERVYEPYFDGNEDSATLGTTLLSSIQKVHSESRLAIGTNITISYPYNTPIYGLQSRLSKELTKKSIKTNINVFTNKQESDNPIDEMAFNTVISSYTLEFSGLSLICSNPEFHSQETYTCTEDIIQLLEWMTLDR